MKLNKLKIESFKKISEIELDLADVNILVGTNGCGKSSIIQAVHLACCVIRQADRVDATKTATVAVDELDYLPTDDYKTLGHNANWGNKAGTPASKVTLSFEKDDGALVSANCTLRSARNAGISITGTVPTDLTGSLRVKKRFFSSYIPGISGIPNKEDKKSKKVILKACSFGDSNVILRNALLLLKDNDPNNIVQIQSWIERIVGPIRIDVSHNDENDLFITCDVTIDGTTKPIELIGTGYLQLIQVFSYILLFGPGVLLIDEPDIHLHPQVQERLVDVLAEVAGEIGVRILLTTHSPFIVRGAPYGTNVFWLHDGKLESDNRYLVELALGWGAFGKKVILVSEDTNTNFLKKIVAQWPEIERVVTFLPGNGFANLMKPKQAKELADSLGQKFKVVIHRDRDSLTDAEVDIIKKKYRDEGVYCWFPVESDVESYFCTPAFLELFLGCTNQEALEHVSQIIQGNIVPIRDQFVSQRAAHNQELYAAGGGPENDGVWAGFQNRPLRGAKGKYVFKRLKDRLSNAVYNEGLIMRASLGGHVAQDIKHMIEEVLGGNE